MVGVTHCYAPLMVEEYTPLMVEEYTPLMVGRLTPLLMVGRLTSVDGRGVTTPLMFEELPHR